MSAPLPDEPRQQNLKFYDPQHAALFDEVIALVREHLGNPSLPIIHALMIALQIARDELRERIAAGRSFLP